MIKQIAKVPNSPGFYWVRFSYRQKDEQWFIGRWTIIEIQESSTPEDIYAGRDYIHPCGQEETLWNGYHQAVACVGPKIETPADEKG